MRITTTEATQMMKPWARFKVYEFTAKDAASQFNISEHSPSERVENCMRGLSYLMNNTGNQPGFNDELSKLSRWNPDPSIESIRAAFDKYEKETVSVLIEEWEEDPEEFQKWHGKPLSECEHPWGDEEVRLYRAWLDLHPFEQFLFSFYCEEAGRDALSDVLGDMMDCEHTVYDRSSEGDSIHSAVWKEAQRLMDRFEKRVEQEWNEKQEQLSIAS